jgi:hypothetical protein
MVDKARLPSLYATVGKLYAELSDFDEALRVLEVKLDEGIRTPRTMELYYSVLGWRKEVQTRIDAGLGAIRSHSKHHRSAIVASVSDSASD